MWDAKVDKISSNELSTVGKISSIGLPRVDNSIGSGLKVLHSPLMLSALILFMM